MYSTYQRLNNLSALLSSCLLALVAVIALSSLPLLYTAEKSVAGSLAVTNVRVFPGNVKNLHQRNREFAFVRFNVTSDLTPLFNWNTKQLFLYLQAEYENAQGVKNDVVIWDRIVRRREDARITVVGKNKYMFKDVSRTFKDVQPANYTLKYNVMPHVGFLTYGEAARTEEAVLFPPMQERVF